MAITDVAARTAKPREKEYKLTDSHGLYLLVKPTGSKRWYLKYRFEGKESRVALGVVAAASFALAKKALVIGYTEQIAPIWNSLPVIDIGNMVEENILPGGTQEELTDAYALMCESGKSAASGSVMKMAQFSSRYQYDPDLARGMYLYEHRRCFDNIIGYCNALCYHGKLQPKRGTEKETLLPAMGYLHIDGLGHQANSGSRYNAFEAETIAAWLAAHKEQIERHYDKPLH